MTLKRDLTTVLVGCKRATLLFLAVTEPSGSIGGALLLLGFSIGARIPLVILVKNLFLESTVARQKRDASNTTVYQYCLRCSVCLPSRADFSKDKGALFPLGQHNRRPDRSFRPD